MSGKTTNVSRETSPWRPARVVIRFALRGKPVTMQISNSIGSILHFIDVEDPSPDRLEMWVNVVERGLG